MIPCWFLRIIILQNEAVAVSNILINSLNLAEKMVVDTIRTCAN